MKKENIKFIEKIKTFSQNLFKKKKEYILNFELDEDYKWYIYLPNYPFNHSNLMMVAGADQLCQHIADMKYKDIYNYNDCLSVSVIPSDKKEEHEGYFRLVRQEYGLFSGSTYKVEGLQGFDRNIWLCPVTIYVLGDYPKYIYVKKVPLAFHPSLDRFLMKHGVV